MRRTGTALAVMSILALIVGITLGAVNAQADKNAAPATNTVINYPSFPLAGGPYLVGSTYDANNTRVILVFNEPVDPASVDSDLTDGSDDFEATFTLTGATLVASVDGFTNVYALDWATAPADFTNNGLERIRMKAPGVINGPNLAGPGDDHYNDDVSWMTIGQGPIPYRVVLNNFTNNGDHASLDAQTLTVTWSENADLVTNTGAGSNATFGTTPELNGEIFTVGGQASKTWTLSVTGMPGDSLLKFIGGVSKLQIASGTVKTTTGSTANSKAFNWIIDNRPPYLLTAYYLDRNHDGTVSQTDELWAIFNEPVDPATLDGGFAAGGNFDTDEGNSFIDGNDGTAATAFPGFTTNAIKLSGFTTTDGFPAPGDLLIHLGSNPLADYQGLAYATDSQAAIRVGPGVIKAIYDDGQTPSDPSNDKLVIFICERISNPAALADTAAFVGDGEWYFGNQVHPPVVEADVDGLCRVTFTDFAGAPAAKRPRAGIRVRATGLATGGGASVALGFYTQDALDTSDWIPVTDESRPAEVQLAAAGMTDEWSTDYNGPAAGATSIDKVTLTFVETGPHDDGDQYFLYFTKTLPQDLTLTWMDLYLSRAIPLGNAQPGILGDTTRVSLLLKPTAADPAIIGELTTTTDNQDIAEGDLLYFLVAEADLSGNVQYYPQQGQGTFALMFGQPIFVGGQCPPRDWSASDDDIIHVVGRTPDTSLTYAVFGDAGSVNCQADSVRAYLDPDNDNNGDDAIFVGHGPVNADGSFPEFTLDAERLADNPDSYTLLLSSVHDVSETLMADWTPILLDREFPTAIANSVYDPWNPYRVYGPDDYLNIRMRIDDVTAAGASSFRNDCARIWADFSGVDSIGTAQTGFGVPSQVVLIGLGRDRVDNDHDWVRANDDVGYMVGGVLVGAGDGVPNFGDPWVDENGNGVFDPGETFIDLVTGGTNNCSTGRWDAGEPNLDSNDPDEQGWYEIEKSGTLAVSGRGTIKQGYPLTTARVRKLAYTDPFSLVTLNVDDNAIDVAGGFMLPTTDLDRSLNETTVLDGTDPTRRFLATIDFHEPTVAEFTSVKNGVTELLAPGNPTYPIGANLDFTISTPSDDDVLFLKMQFKTKAATSWTDLNLDPAGDYPLATPPDGLPGVPLYDDDGDGGIDLADVQVHAADDTTLCKSDLRDNDNDAFFIFKTFSPGDPVNPTSAMGQMVWYNVDENKQNAFDDNDDGALYDAGEAAEALSYNPALDNDEDGIQGGEAVAVRCDGTNVLLANYTGAYPITIYVAASKVYGTRTTTYAAGNDSLSNFYANGMAYTELVERAFGVLTARGAVVANSEKRFLTDASSTTWQINRAESTRRDAATSGTTFGYDWGYGHAFTWSDSKGSTLDLDRLTRLYGLTADGLTQYQLRGVAYDLVGNSNERWTEPVTFTIDLTPPTANIIGCGTTTPPTTGDFLDKNPSTATITEIWDAGQHPGTYTLELASVSDDAVQVLFQERRRNADGTWPAAWSDVGAADVSAPFTKEWPATGTMFTVNNYPAARYQDVQFRAIATDSRGNVTPVADACVFAARVIDSTPPSSWVRGIYRSDGDSYETDDYTPLGVTVAVPQDSSINVWVRIEDNDRDAKDRLTTLLPGKSTSAGDKRTPDPYTTMWAAGVDGKTGNAGANDDADDLVDEDDPGGFGADPNGTPDGIYTLGAGPLGDDRPDAEIKTAAEGHIGAGPDSIPGTADDEWGQGINNDDYITNDVKYVVFQYRRVDPPTEWQAFATIHGDDGTGGQVFDYTQPMKATLNTTDFAEGIYELRAYACDVEGNCNIDTAPIATIAVRANPLRAYIQPEICHSASDSTGVFDLFAVHFIHDYEIDKVRFEYTEATAAGCVAGAPPVWKLIAIDQAELQGDSRGDPVLYMPGQFVPVENPDPIQTLGAAINLNPSPAPYYKYWDADGDGYYSSRDPVVSTGDINDMTWNPGTDANDLGVIGDPTTIPANATLANFRTDEFYAQTAGEAAGLDPTDWIFRENSLNGGANRLDRWNVSWDATGLPAGKYLVRAIAIDAQNNMDNITYTCYDPAQQNPAELELINLNTTPPHATFTTMIVPDVLPGGTSVNLQQPTVIYVPGSSKWVKLNATSADATKLKFEYSLNGGATWTVITPNDDDVFYANIDGMAGYSGPSGFDEVFNDLNGDFVKSSTDFVQDAGVPPTVDTPDGWPLYPQTSGDPVYAIRAPFHVYLDTATFANPLMTDTNIQLRVTAFDQVCGGDRGDPNPDIVTIIWGETQDPVADVIRAEDLNGSLVDVAPPIHDHTPVGTIGADMDTLRVFVTAEDMSTIDHVDLYYRLDPACYASVPEDQAQRPTDLALVLDGSASITTASFTLQKEGVAAALLDPSIIPADGSVAVTVVQFGNGVANRLFNLTRVTSASVAAGLATQVRAMVQLGDGTPTASGIDAAVAAIGAGTPGARQVIIVATDGPPTQLEGGPDPVVAALAAADNAMTAGIDELDALGIGASVDMSFLFQLIRNGSAEQISDYTGFATAIGNKIRSIVFNSLVELRRWKSMSAAGLTSIDSDYPYDFNIATDRIADGIYQFYPRAYDKSGNFNQAPVNPWGFKKFALAGVNFAFVSDPAGPPALPDTAAVGDELVIHGSLQDPALAPTTAVRFYYAQRILDEQIDPATVQPLSPFITTDAVSQAPILGGDSGDGVVLTINGTLATYTASLGDLASPTKFDYTLEGGKIVFGARPSAGDVVLVSYDFGAWTPIAEGDNWSPYTVAWQQQNDHSVTGIPAPANPATDAYDLIAVAKFDLNRDGQYTDDPTDCDYNEPLASEGNYLFLRDEERPKVILYGLAFENFVAPFPYMDWNWPGNPLFRSGDELNQPNYENKLSGIETDVFVDATDSGGGEVASVTLDITASPVAGGQARKTTINMDKISKNTEFVDIPITFYEDDYYSFFVTGFGPFEGLGPLKKNVAPTWQYGPIENVILQVSLDEGRTWTREYQMVRDAATRSWSALGRFDTGVTDETQWYQFIVDLVGDQQAALPDARNLGQLVKKDVEPPYAPYFSSINVPSTSDHAIWYTHLDDAAQLQNNAFHRVVVTATDTFGNTGSNLTSVMPAAKVGRAQGPIVFVLDQTPPVVNAITALNLDSQPLPVTRVSPSVQYQLMANVSDAPFDNINVMSTLGVIYQYSPNNWTGNPSPTWVTIPQLGWALNGMWVANWTPTNPLTDGYDNDGDGLWDEPDEAVANVTIRAIAFDDGLNTGYSDRQATPVTLTLTVDSAEPSAALTQPTDGQVFGYNDSILLSGNAEGDYIPPKATNDVDIVRFQAKINRYFYIDETQNVTKKSIEPAPGYEIVGRPDVYENGLDEVWWDSEGDGVFSPADSCLYPGANGIPFQFALGKAQAVPQANFWFDLDPTPQDNGDAPWLTSANNGDKWEMNWVPSGYSFINADLLGGDEYVRLRMLSRDTAGNWDTENDLLGPKETVIILNDDSVTRAYVTHVNTNDQNGAVDPAETKPVQGLNPINVYGRLQPARTAEVVQVNVYMVRHPDTANADTLFVAMDNSLVNNAFTCLWDANRPWLDTPLENDEVVLLFATAVDIDQNETSKHDATKVRVRIDRTPPVVAYTPLGTYAGFTTATSYTDDGIVGHSSMAITPDIYTGDINFSVRTTASDVATMVLQWRWADDPVGFWRPVGDFFSPTVQPNGMFDYEPNQDFVEGTVAHHVWWLHLENFADVNRLHQTGRMEFRALATDEAGNTNALQTEVAPYTADNTVATLFDWNDDSVTNQIEVGTPVNFEISVQDGLLADSSRTDITQVALFVRKVGAAWPSSPSATVVPEGRQIDSGNAMWIAQFTWTAPRFVVHDTGYEFGVVMTDAAGNTNSVPLQRPGGYVITVEDNAAPDRTKLVDVVPEVFINTGVQGKVSGKSVEDPWVWKDLNDNGVFNAGTDWLISEGSTLAPPPPSPPTVGTAVGDPEASYPRNVGESYLNDARERNQVKIARTVTLVGRTQADDDGIGQADTGIQWVTFVMAPCDANGVLTSTNPADWITLGRDEYRPAFPLYYWHLFLDTTLYPDGMYKLACYALDEEGNLEDQTSLDWTAAIIVIDNENPSAQMDADSRTDTVEKTAIVERNRPFTLFARTLVPGTATLQNYENDAVEFFFKRARDLNMSDSWMSVPDSAGAVWPEEFEDGNPDMTRPYSFDVGMGRLVEPTDVHTNIPLSVGEAYDFVAAVTDEVGNQQSHIASYADSSVAGVGSRYIRLLIQDTIAPHLEFTGAERKAAPWGDESWIENPTKIHAQGFHEIEARLLTGDLDMDHAEFVYRQKGATTWNLIDAILTPSDYKRTWTLGEWDLQTLQHNTWYEVACIGVDNVGNVDQNPDIIEVYVDYEAPPFVLVAPLPTTSKWCRGQIVVDDKSGHHDSNGGPMDLIVQVERGLQQQHDDVYDVEWLWKESTQADVRGTPEDDENPDFDGWKTIGVRHLGPGEDLYDDATNRYSNTLDLGKTHHDDPIFESDLYDLRARVIDVAGNVNEFDVYKNTVDLTEPNYVQISNIKFNGNDTTQDPNDQGQFTDVTSGSMVEVFGTASDNEPDLPDFVDPQTGIFYETMIASMQFQVAFDLNDDKNADDATWHDIGVIHLNPDTLGDMSAQTASILWNTTGLPEGQYLLRVIATDECGNSATSHSVNVRVLDWTPPIARIVAWDPDQQPHGTPAPSLVEIYALAECDQTDADPETPGWQPGYDVQIQYNVKDANETVPTGDWVNIGIAEPQPRTADEFTTEQLWSATVDPALFGVNVSSVWLRALVKDDAGNRYGDKPEDIVPTVLVNVVPLVDDLGVADGTLTIKQVPSAEMQGGSQMVQNVSWMVESPTHVVLTVKMAVQSQAPRVILLAEDANPDQYPSPDHPVNYSPGVEDVGLTRSLDDPTVWRGEIFLQDRDECTHYAMWVSGLDGTAGTAMWIDLMEAYMREFSVTEALGTNGTVKTPAYGSLGANVMVPSGAWPEDPTCLLVSPTEPPFISTDQARYLNPIGQTAYHFEIQDRDGGFTHGYEPLITIKYSQDMAAAALTGTESAEGDLTVRRWDPSAENRDGTSGAWVGTGISMIKTFPDENKVVFRVRDLSALRDGHGDHHDHGEDGNGNVFQLFAPKQNAPVLVSSIWPNSPYTTDWQTDADPAMVIYLRDPAGQVIDPYEVELLIDDEFWATWLEGDGRAEFIRGNGKATLEYANQDQTVMELRYSHSTYPRDWLSDGPHRLTVRYKALNGTDQWMELKDYVFHVDRKAPTIKFDGGFVSNPRLNNVVGYMNPEHGKLVAKLYDGGTGILFKHDRPWYFLDVDGNGILDLNERQAEPCFNPHDEYGCTDCSNWIRVDWGIKYDVWRIHTPDAQPPNDAQHDIDNIEVRTLLHQGTADELEPWLTVNGQPITLDQYTPGTDVLEVPVAVLGGGMIKDNDIIEITWYSDKSIEQNSDGPGYGCTVDTLTIGDEQVPVWSAGCSYDYESQQMHIYNEGIQDWASNSGSKYVEQRFIVDSSCPTITFVEPAVLTVDPNGNLQVVVNAEDDGVGVGTFEVTIMDPSGNVVTPSEFQLVDGRYQATVRGPLVRGEYTVKAVATDLLGSKCEKALAVKVEALVMAMTEAAVAPNPFNPQGGTAQGGGGLMNIGFNLAKQGDVTIKIYDFAGLQVATVVNQKHLPAGYRTEPWAGEADDHTALSNGAYICRITATDGVKTVEQNLKLVIWRE